MARPAKAKRPATPQTEVQPVAPVVVPPVAANGAANEVLTLAEVAAYLRFSEADVLRLVNDQGLPARRYANEWRFLKTAIQHWLSTLHR